MREHVSPFTLRRYEVPVYLACAYCEDPIEEDDALEHADHFFCDRRCAKAWQECEDEKANP